jgi:tRNA(adenine34) deaminase
MGVGGKHTVFEEKEHSFFMNEALKLAQKAFCKDEVPIGAVIVDEQGTIIARTYNKVESQKTQSAHAEVLAITKAAKRKNDWRLDGCWLYVTLEPCTMCMGLIKLSRLSGVVYAAASPLFGYRLDNNDGSRVYKRDALLVMHGLREQDASQLLQQFFKKKRKKRGE